MKSKENSNILWVNYAKLLSNITVYIQFEVILNTVGILN